MTFHIPFYSSSYFFVQHIIKDTRTEQQKGCSTNQTYKVLQLTNV